MILLRLIAVLIIGLALSGCTTLNLFTAAVTGGPDVFMRDPIIVTPEPPAAFSSRGSVPIPRALYDYTRVLGSDVTVAWDPVPEGMCTCPSPPCNPTVSCPGPTYPSPIAGCQQRYHYRLMHVSGAPVLAEGRIPGSQVVVPISFGEAEARLEVATERYNCTSVADNKLSAYAQSTDPLVATVNGTAQGWRLLTRMSAPTDVVLEKP